MVDKRVSVRDSWTAHHERLTPIGRRISHGHRMTYADMAHARCEFITFYTSANSKEKQNIALSHSSLSRVFQEVRSWKARLLNTPNKFSINFGQYQSNKTFLFIFEYRNIKICLPQLLAGEISSYFGLHTTLYGYFAESRYSIKLKSVRKAQIDLKNFRQIPHLFTSGLVKWKYEKGL